MSYIYQAPRRTRLVLAAESPQPRIDIPVSQEVWDACRSYLDARHETGLLALLQWLYERAFLALDPLGVEDEAPAPTSSWQNFITLRGLSMEEEAAFRDAVLREEAGEPETLSQEDLERAYETWQWRRVGQG